MLDFKLSRFLAFERFSGVFYAGFDFNYQQVCFQEKECQRRVLFLSFSFQRTLSRREN